MTLDIKLGAYTLEEFLGAGAYGKVYKGRTQILDENNELKDVLKAIKILWIGPRDELEDLLRGTNLLNTKGEEARYLDQFYSEDTTTFILKQDRQIQMYIPACEQEIVRGFRFLVIDYVDFLPILSDEMRHAKRLNSNDPSQPLIPESIALEITKRFLKVLAVLHQQRYFLKDAQIKNYRVATDWDVNEPEKLTLKILDWNGVLKFEQADGDPVAHDIWNAIAFLYQMLFDKAIERSYRYHYLEELAGARWENVSPHICDLMQSVLSKPRGMKLGLDVSQTIKYLEQDAQSDSPSPAIWNRERIKQYMRVGDVSSLKDIPLDMIVPKVLSLSDLRYYYAIEAIQSLSRGKLRDDSNRLIAYIKNLAVTIDKFNDSGQLADTNQPYDVQIHKLLGLEYELRRRWNERLGNFSLNDVYQSPDSIDATMDIQPFMAQIGMMQETRQSLIQVNPDYADKVIAHITNTRISPNTDSSLPDGSTILQDFRDLVESRQNKRLTDESRSQALEQAIVVFQRELYENRASQGNIEKIEQVLRQMSEDAYPFSDVIRFLAQITGQLDITQDKTIRWHLDDYRYLHDWMQAVQSGFLGDFSAIAEIQKIKRRNLDDFKLAHLNRHLETFLEWISLDKAILKKTEGKLYVEQFYQLVAQARPPLLPPDIVKKWFDKVQDIIPRGIQQTVKYAEMVTYIQTYDHYWRDSGAKVWDVAGGDLEDLKRLIDSSEKDPQKIEIALLACDSHLDEIFPDGVGWLNKIRVEQLGEYKMNEVKNKIQPLLDEAKALKNQAEELEKATKPRSNATLLYLIAGLVILFALGGIGLALFTRTELDLLKSSLTEEAMNTRVAINLSPTPETEIATEPIAVTTDASPSVEVATEPVEVTTDALSSVEVTTEPVEVIIDASTGNTEVTTEASESVQPIETVTVEPSPTETLTLTATETLTLTPTITPTATPTATPTPTFTPSPTQIPLNNTIDDATELLNDGNFSRETWELPAIDGIPQTPTSTITIYDNFEIENAALVQLSDSVFQSATLSVIAERDALYLVQIQDDASSWYGWVDKASLPNVEALYYLLKVTDIQITEIREDTRNASSDVRPAKYFYLAKERFVNSDEILYQIAFADDTGATFFLLAKLADGERTLASLPITFKESVLAITVDDESELAVAFDMNFRGVNLQTNLLQVEYDITIDGNGFTLYSEFTDASDVVAVRIDSALITDVSATAETTVEGDNETDADAPDVVDNSIYIKAVAQRVVNPQTTMILVKISQADQVYYGWVNPTDDDITTTPPATARLDPSLPLPYLVMPGEWQPTQLSILPPSSPQVAPLMTIYYLTGKQLSGEAWYEIRYEASNGTETEVKTEWAQFDATAMETITTLTMVDGIPMSTARPFQNVSRRFTDFFSTDSPLVDCENPLDYDKDYPVYAITSAPANAALMYDEECNTFFWLPMGAMVSGETKFNSLKLMVNTVANVQPYLQTLISQRPDCLTQARIINTGLPDGQTIPCG